MNDAGTLMWLCVAGLAILFTGTLALAVFDRRQLDGATVWAKPLKFELSLALHFATLAPIVERLGPDWRDGGFLRAVAVAAILCTLFEMGYILLQAGRQQRSHFNLSTPFYATLYSVMALGAVVITMAAGAVGVAVAADTHAALGPATRLGAAVGLTGGTILTLVTAFRMGGAMDRHVGTEPEGGARMPLTGWSLTVGDRRVPHFFATHLIQAGPIAGLVADTCSPKSAALILTSAICLIWTGLTWFLFRQANRGLPIFRWDGPTDETTIRHAALFKRPPATKGHES